MKAIDLIKPELKELINNLGLDISKGFVTHPSAEDILREMTITGDATGIKFYHDGILSGTVFFHWQDFKHIPDLPREKYMSKSIAYQCFIKGSAATLEELRTYCKIYDTKLGQAL